MDQTRSGKSGKKGRKIGRKIKKPAQKRYTTERRWLKNKVRKILKYIKSHPNWKPDSVSEEVQHEIKKLRQKQDV